MDPKPLVGDVTTTGFYLVQVKSKQGWGAAGQKTTESNRATTKPAK
jgi:hypothetical protein